jgi:protein SCO1/2
MTPRARQIGGVAALAFWAAVTVGWWALALWPMPGETPEWLLRARAVCFNATDSGLPDASGWLLLVGQPLGMLAVLMVIWGGAVREGLRSLAAVPAGRIALAAAAAGLVLGLGLAGARVVSASTPDVAAALADLPPPTYPRLDREAPALGLLDQHGEMLTLEALVGRPALVTFAFGHCETVCPAVVHAALEVQRQQRERADAGAVPQDRVPRVVVVSLDPWRDTPARLPHVAHHWDVAQDGFVLSGAVPAVNAVLDAWNVARQRDTRTGDVTHPPLVYVLDATGRIAYAATGDAAVLAELLDRS